MTATATKSGAVPELAQVPGTEERFTEVDGLAIRSLYMPARMSSQQPAPSGAPPLVLIHGLLGYSFSWRKNMAALSRVAGVWALDLPGTGFSSRAASDSCDGSMRSLARLVLHWMSAVGIEHADVIGTSHGGPVAMLMAAEEPKRVQRLVLVGAVNPWSTSGRRRIALFSTRPGAFLMRCAAPLAPHTKGIFLRLMYGDARRITAGTIQGYAAGLRPLHSLDQALRIVRHWRADVEELRSVIPTIQQPSLLIWGTRDRAVTPASARQLAQELPHAELVWMDGIGHLPYEEAPDEFNRIVTIFCAGGGNTAS